MSDLPASVWREIETQARPYPDGLRGVPLGALRTIIRKSRRTSEQNRLIWALYEDILERGGETLGGWSRDDLHEFLLGEWSGWTVCEAFGRKRMKPNRRSSRLTKTEFADYVEFIVRRMAEHGIVLELPGELHDSGNG